MTSRVSWSVDGIEPSVRERAEAAARRSGMSLGDWLNSAIGMPDARDNQNIGEIHKRLDSIARQVEQISGTSNSPKNDGVARQLNDAISRLDARLSQMSAQPTAPAYQPAPPTSPQMPQMDFSIAEIISRQSELDGSPMRRMPAPSFVQPQYTAPVYVPPVYAPPVQPPVDFSGIERQMSQINERIDQLRRPDVEQSIASFRGELAEIRHAITEAMPRKAIESLEGEIRSLGRRIDETRSNGTDANALASVERALNDIRGELRSLTPAEQLAGFDGAIRNLGGKIDMIVRSSHDPATIHQLEDAIAALKTIVANVASTDALSQLGDHVQTLSMKVDQLSLASGGGEFLSALEQRIASLTSALETRERPAAQADSTYFDHAVRTISDRLDNLQVGGNDSGSSFSHVEQRVHHLLERLEAANNQGSNLARVEEGLSDILRHLEQERLLAGSHANVAAPVADAGLIDVIKRELTDMRYSRSETDRSTQDSLEVVHSTLGHVVDRLAQIEGDLRDVKSAPRETAYRDPAPREASRDAIPRDAMPRPTREEAPRNRDMLDVPAPRAPSPAPRPELPNPAAMQAPIAHQPAPAPQAAMDGPSMADVAIFGEQIEVSQQPAQRPAATPRGPIDPSLPPDTPLEPGSRHAARGMSTPSERIAASENVLSEIPAGSREPVSTSNFIQAARRAAQAAATAPAAPAAAGPKANRVTSLNDAARNTPKVATKGNSELSSKIRALLVGASVVVIVLGTVKMGMNLLASHETASPPSAESSEVQPPQQLPSEEPRSENINPITPAMTSPTRLEQQSMTPPAAPAMPAAPVEPISPPAAAPSPDVTGSIAPMSPRALRAAALEAVRKAKLIAFSDKLPDSIGGPALRAAALKGEPGAAFEIGMRYAEGRGVTSSYEEAAKWYERASQGGVVPATFRLGTLYEKGLGTKKDIDTARSYYIQAAERGNAKAMHNLAVLAADGGTSGPNYKGAAQWFRKAAERGVADSQYNLGILYARGIGVEQNLAESFKWFSLAAAQGDVDSGKKRDDVAKRLDAQSLAAAKLAIQTFVAEAQPDDATSTAAPAGGWDAAAAPKAAAAKPGKPKTLVNAKLN